MRFEMDEVEPRFCKCGGRMTKGQAMQSTVTGLPDFADGHVVTLSTGGPGKLIDCIKCQECGHSER